MTSSKFVDGATKNEIPISKDADQIHQYSNLILDDKKRTSIKLGCYKIPLVFGAIPAIRKQGLMSKANTVKLSNEDIKHFEKIAPILGKDNPTPEEIELMNKEPSTTPEVDELLPFLFASLRSPRMSFDEFRNIMDEIDDKELYEISKAFWKHNGLTEKEVRDIKNSQPLPQ